jgi:ABC-type transport system involved in multi-copper enzyme maturation permease subunit
MNIIRTILTIASVERTMLYRQAKFWVLAVIGLIFIVLFLVAMNIATFFESNFPGEFMLEGTDAYLALYFFSYLQAVMLIFVSGDFRKAEEHARLDQVMLSRPMTTANWVIGKYLGVVSALLFLNMFLLFLAAVGRMIKVIFAGTGFNILPFLEYFAIVTIPSILFMTALMFLMVSLLRISALAMLFCLGYVASILFYFRHKFLGLFDYGAFFAPVFASDFIGFGDIKMVLWQRLFFVLLAFTLLGITILMYPRLRQSKSSHLAVSVFTGLCLVGGVSVALFMKTKQATIANLQAEDLAFQKERREHPRFRIIHYDLDVKLGDRIAPLKVSAKLAVKNPNADPLAKIVFALNGELRVSGVRGSDSLPILFDQKHQLLLLDFADRPLQPSMIDSIFINYSGSVDADGFMLDRLSEVEGLIEKQDGPWHQGEMSAWLSESFGMLPAQCGWYPRPGVAAGFDESSREPQNFATAEIRIHHPKDLHVITQGESAVDTTGENVMSRFSVAEPLPGFSLNFGPYKKLAHRFNNIDVELYVHENHLLDYDQFADVADTCFEAVDRLFEIFEDVTGLTYPYKKLALVEVPLQVQVYVEPTGVNNILLQPQVIMIDEVTVARRRIKRAIKEETEEAQDRGRDDSPARIKRDVFIGMVLDVLLSDRVWGRDGTLTSPIRNYLHFQVDIEDPILARALELQMYEACERRIRDTFYPDRWNAALSSYDRMRQYEWDWAVRRRYGVEIDSIITALSSKSLNELRPAIDGKLYRACIDFKASPILQMMSELVGEKHYQQALRTLLETNRYQRVGREDLIRAIAGAAPQQDIKGFFATWFDEATFPGYRIAQAKAQKYDTGKMKIVYDVNARIQNGEKGDGFVRVVCETKNDKIRRSLKLGSYEEKEIHFAISDEPERIKVIPYFSRNRGEIMQPVALESRMLRGIPVDTVFVVISSTDSLSFVLDDQDDGFFTPVGAESKYLRPPSKGKSWWEDTNPFAFGKYYFGWRVKRAGQGDYPARWETNVPRDGDYDLSFYYRAERSWYGRNLSKKFEISITSTEGTFPVEVRPDGTADGWFPLGRFHFSKEDPAVVELADTGSGYLIADAIRWEFVE